MTSGTTHSLPVDSIIINREARQRRDLGNVPELAASIRDRGLINPITITRDNILVAGERRLTAVRSLGWSHIHCHYTDELDNLALQAIELEENIKRTELSWQDRIRAQAQFHAIRQEQNPEHTQTQTARELGITIGAMSDALLVASRMSDPKIASAPKLSVAKGIVDRRTSRERDDALSSIKTSVAPAAKAPAPLAEIRHDNFLSMAPSYDGPKFNFLHCDFPYGINADKIKQGSAVATHGGYSDSPDVYFALLQCLCDNLDRLVTPSCHIMFWFSLEFYRETLDIFERCSDFRIDKFPLIWHKTDNTGVLPDPSRGPRRVYETALYGSRGDRKIVQAVGNAYGAPTVRNIHMSEKPEPMLKHFFRMFVDQNSRVLDPTAGSGSAIRAADAMKAQAALGLELNEEYARDAQEALRKAQGMRSNG